MAHTWLFFAGSVTVFTASHWAIQKWVEPEYEDAFKLSRGCAAVLLTGLGIAALIDSAGHWRSAFVYPHEKGDWMRLGLLAVYGHLIADLLWMAIARLRLGIRARGDLIIHHTLGLIAFGFALYLHVGYAIALLTMVAEVLPVTTGLTALGKRINSPTLTDAAERLCLHVLAWLRLPTSGLLLVLTIDVFRGGRAGDLYWVFVVVALALIALITLDLCWIRRCRRRAAFPE
jgi:hypothetical protein